MTRSGRKAAGAVIGVAVLQIVTVAMATAIWVFSTVFAGTACSPECDWVGANLARWLFVGVVVGSFALSAACALLAWRRELDLTWVPLVGTALIVIGLVLALLMYQRAMA